MELNENYLNILYNYLNNIEDKYIKYIINSEDKLQSLFENGKTFSTEYDEISKNAEQVGEKLKHLDKEIEFVQALLEYNFDNISVDYEKTANILSDIYEIHKKYYYEYIHEYNKLITIKEKVDNTPLKYDDKYLDLIVLIKYTQDQIFKYNIKVNFYDEISTYFTKKYFDELELTL